MNDVAVQLDRDAAQTTAPASADRAAAALSRLLAEGIDVHRCAAAQALGRMGHPASIDALIAALLDEDEDVRTDAAGGLARYPDPRAAGPLLESLLGDPCTEVKLAAVEALGKLGHEDAVPWLRRLVRARDEEIAWDDDDFHTSGWDDWTDIQIRAIEALTEMGVPEAVEDIVAALMDEDGQDLTAVAFRALARFGETGRGALEQLLEDGNARCRKYAAATLAGLDRKSEDPGRNFAADAEDAEQAGSEADAPELEALALCLADTKQPLPVRLQSIAILAADGGPEAVEALAGILGDGERQIRLAAMSALVGVCKADKDWPNAAGDALLASLRGELVSAPEPRPVPREEPITDRDERPAAECENEETEADTAFPTSTLGAMLSGVPQADQATKVPEQGMELSRVDMERLALAVRKPGKRVVPVTPDVTPYDDVPRFAARVLGDIPRPEVAVELGKVLGEEDRDKRLAAADSLCRVGEAIGQLPQETIEALVDMLLNTDRDLRLLVVRALGHSGDKDIAKRMPRLLRDGDSFVRVEAVRALEHLDAVGPEMNKLLNDADASVRLAAAGAIAAAQGSDALDRLVEFAFAFEGYHRRHAARLLRDLDADGASEHFVAVLDDQERHPVWQVAVEALEEIHSADRDKVA